MALPWVLTDSDAKNIYTRMCNWYNSPDNLPNQINDTGVFFGYPNFTRDKLWYCIEYLKKNFSRGWFDSDYEQRKIVIDHLASEIYQIFGSAVDYSGIVKFLNWVYNFAKNDVTALNYFQGGGYSYAQKMIDTAVTKVVEPAEEVIDAVKYGINLNSLSFSNPFVKWGLILGGGLIIFNMMKKGRS